MKDKRKLPNLKFSQLMNIISFLNFHSDYEAKLLITKEQVQVILYNKHKIFEKEVSNIHLKTEKIVSKELGILNSQLLIFKKEYEARVKEKA